MATNRIYSIFLLLTFLLISQIDVRLADDESSESPEASTEAAAEVTTVAKERPKGGGKGAPSPNKDPKKTELAKRKGNGKVFQVVVETIKEVNPIRLIQKFDPEPVMTGTGFDSEKLRVPVNYFMSTFFDKLAERSKKSKKELSTLLGVDIEARKEGEWLSIGKMFKVGKQNNLRLGDYLYCFGMNVEEYEKSYDENLIEMIRVPVEFIDEVATEGLHKYYLLFKEYVNQSGGALNAGLKAYGEYTGIDIVGDTKKLLNKYNVKYNYNSSAADLYAKQRQEYEKQLQDFRKQVNKRIEQFYNEWFGRGGKFYVYKERLTRTFTDYNKLVSNYTNEESIQDYIEFLGNLLGPKGKAILYIVYMPTSVMTNQIFGPVFLIPRVLLYAEADFLDKLLALPPIIIQTSGGLFKPVLMVIEPFIRLVRFLSTGEYNKSISAGLDLAASYGISIWGGAYKPKKIENIPKVRSKRAATEVEKKIPMNPELIRIDKKMADAYQGGPPPGGYKLGVKNDGVDLDDEDMISRIMLSPDFILKVGGPVFVPFASVLAPALRVVNTLAFGKEKFMTRMAEVPDILKGVGMIGELSEIIERLLPVIKVVHQAQGGNLTTSQAVYQAPSVVKVLMTAPVYPVLKNPQPLINKMLKWLDGNGGVLAMLRLQATADLPIADPGAAQDAKKEMGPEALLIVKIFGDLFGGWLLGYLQGLGPVASTQATFFNGLIGNVLDPVKFLNQNVELKKQPLKNLLNAFNNLTLMYKSCADKRSFLTAVLGGNDPDVFNEIGIHADKMVENGIDVGILLAGGTKMLDENSRKKLESEHDKFVRPSLPKIGLDSKKLLENGLLEAKEDKLVEAGIHISLLYGRVLRGALEDESKLSVSGISLSVMLKAGICPAKFLAGGVQTIPEEKLKALGISNSSQLSEDNIKALGLNSAKLNSLGIQPKRLAAEGLESYAQLSSNVGINLNLLLMSIYTGMNPNKLRLAGIDLKAFVRSRIDTKTLLTGGLKKELSDDLSKEKLSKVGVDIRQITAMNINLNLISNLGIAVLNPMSLVKMGIDPMPSCIAILSRHGLQSMTGGVDDANAVSFGFINSVLRIINNMIHAIPNIRDLPGGKSIQGPNGRFIGPAAVLMYNIIGIDNNGVGLIGIYNKALNGTLTTDELIKMFDLEEIAKTLKTTGEKTTPKPKRIKSDQKAVDEYLIKASNLRVGQSRPKEPVRGKSHIYGNKEDTYDESVLLPTTPSE